MLNGRRFGDRCEFHEPDAIREGVADGPRGLDRQAGLAHTPRADKRYQSTRSDLRGKTFHLVATADKARRRERQIPQTPAGRPQRRELPGHPRANQLKQGLRARQTLEWVLPECDQLHAAAQLVTYQLLSRQGHQHLTTMSEAHHPGSAVHGQPEIVAVTLLRCSDMYPHTDPERHPDRPRLGLQQSLSVNRSRDRISRSGERRAERIPRSGEHKPTTTLDRTTNKIVMARQRQPHRVGLPLPQ